MHLIHFISVKEEVSCSLMVPVSYPVFPKSRHMAEIRQMNPIQASFIS